MFLNYTTFMKLDKHQQQQKTGQKILRKLLFELLVMADQNGIMTFYTAKPSYI